MSEGVLFNNGERQGSLSKKVSSSSKISLYERFIVFFGR
jgi:hypothetical protein